MKVTRTKTRDNLKDKVNDEAYREFYLETDINRAKLATLVFTIPAVGFVFNDYQFFGLSDTFFKLAFLRVVSVFVIAAAIVLLSRAKNYRSYERIVFISILFLLANGGVISALRPAEFSMQAIMAIISIFIIYIVVPFSFKHQCFLASATAIVEAIIVIVIVKPTETTVLFSLLYSLLISSIIAAVSSWQLHAYRRRTFSEVIQRRQIQEKLENYSQQLEKIVKERTEKLKNAERFAAIGATAGMVGHDLRNPLTGISNATYYLNKKYSPKLDEQGKEMIQILQKNVDYSNKIINDLLDYAGNINLDKPSVTNPKKGVNEALELVSCPETIKVVDQTQPAPTIKVDLAKIKRVLVNIIKNAVDAMPDGGVLTLKSTEEDDKVKIIISDTGVGISQEYLDKLFQPLFTTKAKGMGFGLAICQRIVEAHQGKISAESKLGVGTKFIVELPINRVNESSA